jgi:glutathione S-transferase
MSLTLYYHPLSSYCHKVLIALYECEAPFDKRIIDLGNEPDRAELQALWPLGKFPVIRDHERNRAVAESTIIIEYLDHFFAGARRLIPADWDAAFEVRAWDRFCDQYVHGPMQLVVKDKIRGARGDLNKERAQLETAYRMLDEHMAGRTWAVRDTFSMADCAAAPSLFFSRTLQAFPEKLGHLSAYFDRLMDRPSTRRVLDEAKPYFHMYPFADAIAPRFRAA